MYKDAPHEDQSAMKAEEHVQWRKFLPENDNLVKFEDKIFRLTIKLFRFSYKSGRVSLAIAAISLHFFGVSSTFPARNRQPKAVT